jgi:hypothetical protein
MYEIMDMHTFSLYLADLLCSSGVHAMPKDARDVDRYHLRDHPSQAEIRAYMNHVHNAIVPQDRCFCVLPQGSKPPIDEPVPRRTPAMPL